MNKFALCCLALLCTGSNAHARSTPQVDPATAPASTTAAPVAMGRCGRISVFDVAPRNQDIYRAKLINIDGQLPGPTNARSFRVTPGKHTLEVAELIDNEQFNDLQLRQRVQQSDRYKSIELDVQPNTTYLLGAHLIESRRNYITDRSYWEPVIYHQNSEACQ
jgi:hypothetical protein